MNTVQQAWDLYKTAAVPPNAGPAQRLETRRAFYAGAGALLLMSSEVSNDGSSEDAAAGVILGWVSEVRCFLEIPGSGAKND
jgi:hypothetical protein